MPTFDEEFLSKLRATFKVEAEEHLQTMSANLLELEKSPAVAPLEAVIELFYRDAHSLKGAARAVDMGDVEAICHALEGVIAVYKREKRGPLPESIDVLHQALDMIRALLSDGSAPDTSRRCAEIIAHLNAVPLRPPEAPTPSIAHAPDAPASPPSPPLAPGANAPLTIQVRPVPISAAPVEGEKASAAQTVRIAVSKLDSHLLDVEDLLAINAMMAQRVADLDEMRAQFERWQGEWAKIPMRVDSLRRSFERGDQFSDGKHAASAVGEISGLVDAHDGYLRSLESRLSTLAAQAAQDRHSAGRRVDELLEDAKKLLMMPFATLAGSLPKIVRDLCRDRGKEADLVIRGGAIEIDKRILEEMKDPFIHILRNCVDHGIETPAQRASAGKPPRGAITITVSAINGSKVEILVSDDGAGVNVERVRQAAIRHGIISVEEAGALPDDAVLPFIFRSEITTSPVVTTTSGRGLGMAIVRARAEALGGHISVESRPGGGTALRMLLPLTLATFRGILLNVAGQLFVAPTANVERALRVKLADIRTVENRETISLEGQVISVARMSAVLRLPASVEPADPAARIPLLVLVSAGERVAFVVDHVLHEAEVLVKSFRRPLVRIRHLSGATVLGSGKIVPVLNVGDLLLSARGMGAPPVAAGLHNPPPEKVARRVLVVEDSITSRMLLKGVLESAGYHVQTAVDGVDAFTILREQPFDLVVSDVEMPRMNGFDLTARIRLDKRLGELPVILVTALENREERERGIDAGASAYITKSTFDRNNLLEVIDRLAL